MLRTCLCLLAGVYALQFDSAMALLVLLAVLIVAGWRAIAVAGIGIVLFHGAAMSVIDARIDPDYVGDSIVVTVRVADFPTTRGSTTNFVGEVRDNLWVPRRIRVSWFEPARIPEFGDVWQLEMRLRRPRATSNPGLFDYETWLFRERIAATAYVVDSHRNKRLDVRDLSLLDRVRQHAVTKISEAIVNREHAAVLMAISVGARHAISAEQWDRYARTGTSHLMAISGLHIGLAAAGGYAIALIIAGVFFRHACQRQLATAFSVLVAMLYALVSGLAVPAQRATLMIGLGGVALLTRREVRPFAVIAAACIVVTAMDPLATMAPGFKLSFLAVVILLWLARQCGTKLSLFVTQLYLFCGLLPLVVMIFARMSFAAPFINVIAVPVFSFVTVPFVLLGLIAGSWPLQVAAVSLGWIESLLTSAAAYDVASVVTEEFSGAAQLLLLVPLVWVVLPRAWPGRSIAWLGVAALAGHSSTALPNGCVAIDVLDVGQGLAISVATHQVTTIYDTGPAYRGAGSAAETVVLPFLAHRGIDSLDRIVVTHADLDHAGGIETIRNAMPHTEIIVGETIDDLPSATPCTAGQGWHADGIEFTWLWPQQDIARRGNDASCVLQIAAGEYRVLLTGDIEREAEQVLASSGQLQSATAVVIPHHGSSTSSTPSFVAQIEPQLAIVSAGYNNRWNLPAGDVVRRWQDIGAEVLSTAESGAISLRVCEHVGIVSIRRDREQRRRLWHE